MVYVMTGFDYPQEWMANQVTLESSVELKDFVPENHATVGGVSVG